MAKAKIVHKANSHGWARCAPAYDYLRRGDAIAGAVAFAEAVKSGYYTACPNC